MACLMPPTWLQASTMQLCRQPTEQTECCFFCEALFAGETLAMSDRTDNAIFLAALFSELTNGDAKHAPPIICVTDNHSLSDALKSTKAISEKKQKKNSSWR